MSAAEISSISSELDIFAHKPIPTSVLGPIETAYTHNAPLIKMTLNF